MLAKDIMGTVAEPVTGLKDFGLSVSNIMLPLFWLYRVSLWFRGFLLRERTILTIAAAIVTLPAWFIFIAISAFRNLPLDQPRSPEVCVVQSGSRRDWHSTRTASQEKGESVCRTQSRGSRTRQNGPPIIPKSLSAVSCCLP